MTISSKVRTGYGLNLHTQKVWCDDAENLRCLIACCSTEFKNKFDWNDCENTEQMQDVTAILESFHPDSPKMALATILAEAIRNQHGIMLTAAIDFADSDIVILAMPNDDPQRLRYSNAYLRMVFQQYTNMLSWRYRYQPEYISWHVEVKQERRFIVDTPAGKILIRAKSENDADDDYPGVYIDFIAHDSGEEVSLACVEFAPDSDTIATDVYHSEECVDRFYRKNLPGAELAVAKKYIYDFLHKEYGSDVDEDFHDLSHVAIAWGNPDEQEQVEVNVYADLQKHCIRTYLTASGHNAVLVSTNQYPSLEELTYNELDSLNYDALITIMHEEWVEFSKDPGTQVWLREQFPVGATRRFAGYNDDYDGTIKGLTESGRIIVEEADGNTVDLLYCGDLFAEVE